MKFTKILYITTRLPFPPVKGDQAVTYNRTMDIGADVECHLLTAQFGRPRQDHIERLRRQFRTIEIIVLNPFRALLALARGLYLINIPFQVLLYSDPRVSKKIRSFLANNPGTLINEVLIRNHENIRRSGFDLLSVEMVDSMVLNFRRRVSHEHGVRRIFFAEELRRLRHYEKRVIRDARITAVVSSVDRAELGDPESVVVVPIGIRSTNLRLERRFDLVFSGNMGYFPNRNAIEWFVRRCLPLVRRMLPQVSMSVLGGGLDEEGQAMLQDAGVEYRGRVDDMQKELSAFRVAIAPMQAGSGMQFKVLEAMAVETAVVCSSIVNEPIGAKVGYELLVGDDPHSFAAACVLLLTDSAKRETISLAAMAFVKSRFSWDSINSSYLSLLRDF